MSLFLKGDCLELMKTLPDKSIDCFVCDLPYGCLSGRGISVDRSYRGGGIEKNTASGCPWDIPINLEQLWIQIKRLCRNENTPVLMFCNTKFGNELINSNPDWFRYDLVWNKERGVSFLLANKMPMKSHEMIYVFSKKGSYYKRIDIEGDFKFQDRSKVKPSNTTTYSFVASGKCIPKNNISATERCPLSVINVKGSKTQGNHPTEKPKELYEWLLKRYCVEGGTMLDATAGSFNSVFVAQQLGYKGIGIEKDNKFFYKAIQQLQNHITELPSMPS